MKTNEMILKEKNLRLISWPVDLNYSHLIFSFCIRYTNYLGWILQTGLLCLPVIFCLLGDDVTVSLCWVWHKAITVPCSDWWIGWQPGSQLAESVRRCEHSWLAYGPVFPHSLSCTFVIFCVFILRNYIIIMITAILLVSVATCLVSAKPTIYKVDEERNIAESILTPVSSTGRKVYLRECQIEFFSL